ncbi:ATP-binding protein [Streptomyces sp. NPDC002143]
MPAAGVATRSAFADAVLLVTSELAAHILRYAPHSPGLDVGLTSEAGYLVVSVADAEPALPDLTETGMGAELRMVAESREERGMWLRAFPYIFGARTSSRDG